jgi:hypothetical protein
VRPTGAVRFRVLWGDPNKGMSQVIVEAHDPDEALILAHQLHPELSRPRTAFLVNEFCV